LSFTNSLNLSSLTTQLRPSGADTYLPDGVIIVYLSFSVTRPTLKFSAFQFPLGSLSGFLYADFVPSDKSNFPKLKLLLSFA
jgi:hypothetical protein